MTTVANIAQQILDENNWETTDIHATGATALTRVEYMVDNAIDTINLRAGTSIADLSGSAGSKSITGTESEILVVKEVTVLGIRAYLDRGPNVNVPPISASAVLNDPQYDYYSKAIKEDIERLKELPIVIANDPLPNE